jgi:serine protease Do
MRVRDYGLLTFVLLIVGVSVVSAQDELNFGGEPTFGTFNLQANFSPDPHIVTVVSGGSVDVAAENLGEGCRGYAASNPDYRINWTGSAANLRIFFVSEGDAALIVNTPSGEWVCNDDADALNPVLNFPNALEGQYDIWVGSYSQSDYIHGYLMITQLDSRPSAIIAPLLTLSSLPVPQVAPTSAQGTALDFTLTPLNGSVTLAPGFAPDPLITMVNGGGNVDVAAENLGPDCLGYTSPAPNYRLVLTGESANLRIFYIGDQDPTMIVSTPTLEWACNDDSFGTVHPTLDFPNATSGTYDIWIGGFTPGSPISGTLYITELLDNNPSTAAL